MNLDLFFETSAKTGFNSKKVFYSYKLKTKNTIIKLDINNNLLIEK